MNRIIIGSSEQCDIVLAGDNIAATHACLEIHPDQMSLVDLARRKDIEINGSVLSLGTSVAVQPKDHISIGGRPFPWAMVEEYLSQRGEWADTAVNRLLIGSDSQSCDIVLDGEKVSSVHASVFLDESGEMWLRSVGTEPLYINGKASPGKTRIHPQDRIRIGDTELSAVELQAFQQRQGKPASTPRSRTIAADAPQDKSIRREKLASEPKKKGGSRVIAGHEPQPKMWEEGKSLAEGMDISPPPGSSLEESQNSTLMEALMSRNMEPQRLGEKVDSDVGKTLVNPFRSGFSSLLNEGMLLPAFLFLTSLFSLFLVILVPSFVEMVVDPAVLSNYELFMYMVGGYLCVGAFGSIYLQCRKPKPASGLMGIAVMEAIILSPLILPYFGWLFQDFLMPLAQRRVMSLGQIFVFQFIGVGLMEELVKVIPIFLAILLGKLLRLRGRRKRDIRWGVFEPLDAIIYGTLAGTVFTMIETLGQYVPMIKSQVGVGGGSDEAALLEGMAFAVVRILGALTGHIAYSGYFGYFIGLAIIKPHKRWRFLAIGWLMSSFLHALHNTSGTAVEHFSRVKDTDQAITYLFLNFTVGAIAFFALLGVIMRAREISPYRTFARRRTPSTPRA